jgi:NADPH:quinone reductase
VHGIVVRRYGGPDVLRWEELPDPSCGPLDAVIRVTSIGVNFVDTYYRSGEYRTDLPMTPGMEAEGYVEAVGAEVTGIRPDDHVAFAMHLGAYAEFVRIPADRLVRVPTSVPPSRAAAGLLQGMTAHFLAHDLYDLKPDQVVLVHAAAGGLGQLLIQMLKPLGVRIIGTASSAEKAQIAATVGADHVINYTEQNFAAEVESLTGGRGVAVVFDSVGKDTWQRSLSCVQPRGMLVLCGQASGPTGPIDPQQLRAQGSILLARPSLSHFINDPGELQSRAADVLGRLADGSLAVKIVGRFPLGQAEAAHRLLESRETHGKIMLTAWNDSVVVAG